MNNNAGKLVASGLLELELALTRFLIDSKSRHFLLRMCDRAVPLMDSGQPHGGDAALKQRIRSLRARLEPGFIQLANLQEVTKPLSEKIPKPSKAQPCEICREVDDKIFAFLCYYQSALITDSEERARFVIDGGFCTRHWWLYASIAAPRDICVAVAPLLARISTELQTSTAESANSLALGRVVFKAATRCRLCSLQRTIEREAVARLTPQSGLATPAGLLRQAPCLPHLYMISEQLRNPAILCVLLPERARVAERLAEDMQRYALKHDGVRRALTSEEEEVAAASAISLLASSRLAAK
jgi:hypothetical protein